MSIKKSSRCEKIRLIKYKNVKRNEVKGVRVMELLVRNECVSEVKSKLLSLSQKTKRKRAIMSIATNTKKDEVVNKELSELEKDIYSTIK